MSKPKRGKMGPRMPFSNLPPAPIVQARSIGPYVGTVPQKKKQQGKKLVEGGGQNFQPHKYLGAPPRSVLSVQDCLRIPVTVHLTTKIVFVTSLGNNTTSAMVVDTGSDVLAIPPSVEGYNMPLLSSVAPAGPTGGRAESCTVTVCNSTPTLGIGGRMFHQNSMNRLGMTGIANMLGHLDWTDFVNKVTGDPLTKTYTGAQLSKPHKCVNTVRDQVDFSDFRPWIGTLPGSQPVNTANSFFEAITIGDVVDETRKLPMSISIFVLTPIAAAANDYLFTIRQSHQTRWAIDTVPHRIATAKDAKTDSPKPDGNSS